MIQRQPLIATIFASHDLAIPMCRDATIIIPQFNQIELTLSCCESIRTSHSIPPNFLVVDDGSGLDGLSEQIPELSDCGDLLLLPHRGVTAAWNAGLYASRTRWLIFLNNDTTSLGSWCEQLLSPLRSGAAAMSGIGWRVERHLPTALAAAMPGRRWLPGWCFAVERSRLLDLGGFDESLALYFSDTDLQVRLRLKCELPEPLIAIESLPLLHDGHRTAHRLPNVRTQWQLDRRQFHRKWRGGSAAQVAGTGQLAGRNFLASR